MEFKLHSRIPAHRRPAAGNRSSGKRLQRRQPIPDFAGGYGLWQDLHHGQRHPANYRSRPSSLLTIRRWRDSSTASSRSSSRRTRWSILSPTTTTTSRKPTSLPQTPTLPRIPAINDEIDKLRLSATASLAERKDVIVVASVSCIYGLGSPG